MHDRNFLFTGSELTARVQESLSPVIRVTRETHEAPDQIQERVERVGGTNCYGEANFRVVWGGARLTWIGGRWTDNDGNGNVLREAIETRRVPKYLPLNRWHIERWAPRESYGSPEEWYAQTTEVEDGIRIAALGPYPSRGEYEHCFTLEGPSGEFLQLTPTAAEHIARAIEFSRHLPRARKRDSVDDRERREDRAYDAWAYDQLDNAVPAFHKQPFVTVA
jgi:hypothetical protein